MISFSERTEKLIGENGVDRLKNSSVLIVGIGGVGGCVFEMLVRAGLGNITVVDGDVFEASNLNRQILSSKTNIGFPKTAAAVQRAKEISPQCRVTEKFMRFCIETADDVFDAKYDYVADCIDSVDDKTHLIMLCKQVGVPVISAMGSGNRVFPEFKVLDIYKTSGDGLARVMRKKLRQAGIASLKTVCDISPTEPCVGAVGTISYAPNLAGCVMAREIINDILWK